MRRPLKPFVTEYKGSNRRNLAAPIDVGLFESERAVPPKPFDFAARPEAEDSYDAAMRAADALFSIPPATSLPPDTDPRVPDDMAQPLLDERMPQPAPPEKMGGRILRVIDEAPSPEYAALEAERAPKRRGRKPGSKNKPKPPSVVALSEAAVVPQAPPGPPSRVRKMPAAPLMPAVQTIAALAAEAAVTAAPAPGTPAPRVDKRFAWARDKLKPGEDWKRRRLPRVCW